MSHLSDVPPAFLLPRVAEKLRERRAVTPPEWAAVVKTGVHKQRAPVSGDWWYLRSASVLRKLALRGPIGIERLASEYGGKRDRGSAPYHTYTGSRSILRAILQQLQQAHLIQSEKNKGRRLSSDGHKFLDAVAREALHRLSETHTELRKYQ